MAVSKILHMKDTGKGFHGKHLKSSIEYIINSEKTQQGRLVGAINCLTDNAFEQMRETKKHFNKTDKRQGYHLILSFREGETDADIAFELTEKFVKQFIGDKYEAVFAVHDNTDHIHSHIIFNSVSFVDGRKYRYEKGDWAKTIQPVTNRLCQEYGLSVLDIEEEQNKAGNKKERYYREWDELRDGRFVWSDMIKRDVDACILQVADYDSFLEMMGDKGYEFKNGKHPAVRPMGMKRFRRLDTLGSDYTHESILQRIKSENMSHYKEIAERSAPKIVRSYVKRYRRAKLSGVQKKYYARLYKLGKLKKRPYSQAWKYKDDIKKMNRLQQEYLFLVNHDIHTAEELVAVVAGLSDRKKEVDRDKSRVYRAGRKYKLLFDIADEMTVLLSANEAYRNSDEFFVNEHKQWEKLNGKLAEQGYSYEEVLKLRQYYKMLGSEKRKIEAAIMEELKHGERILEDISLREGSVIEKSNITEKERIRDDGRKQPVR